MTDAQTQSDRANEVAVLVPAAGMGTRLGGRRKQFRLLGDRPLLAQTLLVFERHPGVGHVIVAAPEAEVRDVSDRLQAEGLSKLTAVVSGGTTRQDSVRHALRAVPAPVEVVLVHDAVRPFVRHDHVADVIASTRRYGAAALAVPVADTLRRAAPRRSADDADGGEPELGDEPVFGDTVPREGLYRMQTPQGFRRAWLEEAHADAVRSGRAHGGPDGGLSGASRGAPHDGGASAADRAAPGASHAAAPHAPDPHASDPNASGSGFAPATDDVELVQRAGRTVHVVEGSARNFKITTPSDWALAEQLWPHWTSDDAFSGASPTS